MNCIYKIKVLENIKKDHFYTKIYTYYRNKHNMKIITSGFND